MWVGIGIHEWRSRIAVRKREREWRARENAERLVRNPFSPVYVRKTSNGALDVMYLN